MVVCQPRRTRSSVVLWCILLSLVGHVSDGQQDASPVELQVTSYIVVYMEDESDRRWSVSEAQTYCNDRYSTSLASFHDSQALLDVLDVLDSTRNAHYRIGLTCDEKFTAKYKEYIGLDSVPKFYQIDGTPYDYGFGEAQIIRSDIALSDCPVGLVIHPDPEDNRFTWIINTNNDNTSALICNSYNNSMWKSMNPPRTEFVSCDENNDCIMDCINSPQCQYYENHSISDMKSLIITGDSGYGGYGMNITVSNVKSVAVMSRAGHRGRGTFQGASLAFFNCSEVSLEGRTQHAYRVSVLYFEQGDSVSISGSFGFTRLALLIAKNISNQVLMDCAVSESCNALQTMISDSASVSYSCAGCKNIDSFVTNVDSVTFDCVRTVSGRPVCGGSTFVVNNTESTQESSHSVTVRCQEIKACEGDWTIVGVNNEIYLECLSEDSCQFRNEMNDMIIGKAQLTLLCETENACRNIWPTNEPLSPERYTSVLFICRESRACFPDESSWMKIGDGSFDIEIECYESQSFGMGMIDVNGSMTMNMIEDETRSMNIVCKGFGSCSESSDLESFVTKLSEYNVRMQVDCVGRESCLESDWSGTGERSELAVFCRGDNSCESMRVNGYCMQSVRLEISSPDRTSDVTVICPSKLIDRQCETYVNKYSVLSKSRIGMSGEDWKRKKRFTIAGKSDALLQVTSLHLDNNQDCLQAGLNDQALCFLVESERNQWTESQSCSNFILSLYSPMTLLVASLTTLLGVLFLISAMNQTHDKDNDDTDDASILLLWLRNAMNVSLIMISMNALISSLILLSHQNTAQSEMSSGDIPAIPASFFFFASLTFVSLVCFVSWLECWLLVSGNDAWNPIYRYLRKKQFTQERTRMIIWIISVRTVQMFVYYIVSSLNDWAALMICVLIDLIMIVPSLKMTVVCCYCLMIWLFSSQYSPIPQPFAELTFFQVITNNTRDESAQAWFDVLCMALLWSVATMAMTGRNGREIAREQTMFLQFFDYATDVTILLYWLINEFYLWSSIQLMILMSTSVMQWCVLHDDLHHWKEHLMIVSGLGRGYTKLRLWFGYDERWLSIDRRCTLIETFYESMPSMMFGLYIFLSDIWDAHLSDVHIKGVSNDFGPLLLSLFITGIAIAVKTILYTLSLKTQNHSKAFLFFFTLTDWIIRTICLAVCFALLQGSTDNRVVSLGLMIGFPLMMVALMIEHSIIIYYCLIKKEEWRHFSVIYSIPCSLSCSPILFHCLSINGITQSFDLARCVESHIFVLCQSVAMLILCVSIQPECIAPFSAALIAFICCFLINLICIPFVRNLKLVRS